MELYKNHIPIGNIYYMLCYAFRNLQEQDIVSVKPEEFDNIQQLMAEIVIRGVSYQLKKGLLCSYEYHSGEMSVVRGKIDISETINSGGMWKRKLACSFDEYTENTLMNQILKSVMLLLIRSDDVKKEQTSELRRLVRYFSSVSQTDLMIVRWNSLVYSRNHGEYRLLMDVCRIICENMIHSTEDGNLRLTAFSDKNIAKLYEKFILKYFERHYNKLKPSALKIGWNVENKPELLPDMRSDAILTYNDRQLVIDAKFYSRTTQVNYEKDSFHSHNLYQIFTYVKNEEKFFSGEVSGLLLYAKTKEDKIPNEGEKFKICNSEFSVKSLDLSGNFESISKQLNAIANEFMSTCRNG